MGAPYVRRELVSEFIRPAGGARVLDVGCGTAEILAFLPGDVDYWGFDISARYVDAAATKFGERGRFHCARLDARQIDSMPRFDIVIAIGLLHHLDDSDALGLFELARRALSAKGRVVTLDPCLAPDQNPIARFLIERDRGQNVRTAEAYRALPGSVFGNVQGQLRHRRWIPYTLDHGMQSMNIPRTWEARISAISPGPMPLAIKAGHRHEPSRWRSLQWPDGQRG
jgi:SAM-dependent methyltransferase